MDQGMGIGKPVSVPFLMSFLLFTYSPIHSEGKEDIMVVANSWLGACKPSRYRKYFGQEKSNRELKQEARARQSRQLVREANKLLAMA